MYNLGISCYYHDSAAALLQDGHVIAAVEEERFSRNKFDDGFPKRAIEWCLNESKITPELIESKVKILNQSLKKDFNINKPKIAVLGLNPHSGDNGIIGKEENDLIKPTIKSINENGILVFGPYAADGFFGSETYKQFDGVLAMYHDQGLAPFKALTFGNGVNFTAGLSHVRTSPDHGTAFDISGKGVANSDSFKEAVFTGIKIFKNRKEYKELTQNVLKQKKQSRN